MKQESVLSPINSDDDMDVVLTAAGLTEDIVEDFARQLDQVVRIQDAMEEIQVDDQEDDHTMYGYQQLPQDDDDGADDDDDEEEEKEVVVQVEEGDITDPLQIEVSKVDQLEPETFDLIKSIMSNIQLSDKAIPEWAKKIPEEAWLPRTAIEKK